MTTDGQTRYYLRRHRDVPPGKLHRLHLGTRPQMRGEGDAEWLNSPRLADHFYGETHFDEISEEDARAIAADLGFTLD